jgi:hypothetical protein
MIFFLDRHFDQFCEAKLIKMAIQKIFRDSEKSLWLDIWGLRPLKVLLN